MSSPLLDPRAFTVASTRPRYVSFNSLTQLEAHARTDSSDISHGVRLNLDTAFAADWRYDAGRGASKLGITSPDLLRWVDNAPAKLSMIRGLHVHNNCESHNLEELAATATSLAEVARSLAPLEWVNLGGGYEFQSIQDLAALTEAVAIVRTAAACGQIFLEPGAAFVREAWWLVATVVDLIPRSESQIAVIDAATSHWPEVFEYSYSPPLVGATSDGKYTYDIAGATCLAGDLFGRYSLSRPLAVGDRIAFGEAGAYSFVKANRFNGLEPPWLFELTGTGEFNDLGRVQLDWSL